MKATSKLDSFIKSNPKRLFFGMMLIFSLISFLAIYQTNEIYNSALKEIEISSTKMLKIYSSSLETKIRNLQDEVNLLSEEYQKYGAGLDFNKKSKFFLNRYSDITDTFIISKNKFYYRYHLTKENLLTIETFKDTLSQNSFVYKISMNNSSFIVPISMKKYISTLRFTGMQGYLVSLIQESESPIQYWYSKSLNNLENCNLNLNEIPKTWIESSVYRFEHTQLLCGNKSKASLTSYYPITLFGKQFGLTLSLIKKDSFSSIDSIFNLMIFLIISFLTTGGISFVYIRRINQIIEFERRENDAQLVQASKLSSIGEMSGNIAHEINNPIAVIGGAANFIKKEIESENISFEKINKQVARIEQMVDRIAKIIKSLRTFSRDAETIEFNLNDLAKVVDESLDLLKQKIKNSGVELKWNPDFDKYFSNSNYIQLGQIIINLTSNSIDAHTSHNSDNTKYLKFEVMRKENKNIIVIEDNGPGIPSQLADRIFEPFFTTKQIGQGTGLGLSISMGIIKKHQGVLKLESQTNPTRFIIELPATTATEQAA